MDSRVNVISIVVPTKATVLRIEAEPNSTYTDNFTGLVNRSSTWLGALSVSIRYQDSNRMLKNSYTNSFTASFCQT